MPKRLSVLLGCAVVAAACSASPTGPTDGARSARLSRTRFMAFGDSLTTGEVTAPIGMGSGGITKMVVVPAASYPSQLLAQLSARYPSQASVISMINAGLGGETVLGGVLRIGDAIAAHSPDVVLIMEGINQLAPIGPEVSALLVRDMTRTARDRGVRAFVGSMLPTIAGRQRTQNAALLEAYNARLRQMCVEEGVVFVDLYTTLTPEALNVIGIDGLHPTEAGYRRIAELFFAAIQRELEER